MTPMHALSIVINAFAILLILPGKRLKMRLWEYIAAFFLISVAQFIWTGYATRNALFYGMVLVPLLWHGRALLPVLHVVLDTLFALWLFIAGSAVLVYFIAPSLYVGNPWQIELLMCLLVTAFALVWRKRTDIVACLEEKRSPPKKKQRARSTEPYVIGIEAAAMLFSTLFPFFPQSDMQLLAFQMLFFIALLLIVAGLLYSYQRTQAENRRLQTEQEQVETLRWQQERWVESQHTENQLFLLLEEGIERKDFDDVERVFRCYIQPRRKRLAKDISLDNVEDELLRRILEQSIASLPPGVQVDCEIPIAVALPTYLLWDVSRILLIWTENALRALQEQENGLLRIAFLKRGDSYYLQLANSIVTSDASYGEIINGYDKGHGNGLKVLRKIARSREELACQTFLDVLSEPDYRLFVQSLSVECNHEVSLDQEVMKRGI